MTLKVLNITEGAITELQRVKKESNLGEDTIVRVGVEGGGCSGFSYKIGFDDIETVDKTEDTIVEESGLKFVVDKKSVLYIEGTTLDWYEDLAKRGFSFNNPNATKSCGCGSSFSV